MKRLKAEISDLKLFLDKLIKNELKSIFTSKDKSYDTVNDLAIKIAEEYKKNGINANDLKSKKNLKKI